MVTREDFKMLIKGLKGIYSYESFIPDIASFNMWYEILKDFDYEVLSSAIQYYIRTEEKPPVPASIVKAASKLVKKAEPELNEEEAWSLVYQALSRSIYYSEDEYAKLPAIVRKAIGNPANLREMAMMDIDTVQSVEKSHFVRVYRAECQKANEISRLSPALQNRLVGSNNDTQGRIEEHTR